MNKFDLLKYPSVKRMVETLRAKRGGEPSPSTERGFLTYLQRYCDFYAKQESIKNITPEIIMEARKKDWLSNDDDVRRKHEDIVMRFMNEMKKDKDQRQNDEALGETSSSGKVAYALTAVRAFYRSSWRELKGIPTPQIITQTKYKVPTPEELADVCEKASERLRTWILVDKDTGMSPIDLLNLTGNEMSARFGSVKEQLKHGQCPLHLHIVREKTKTTVGGYDTFVGEDGFEALQNFMLKRRLMKKVFDVGLRNLEIEFEHKGTAMGWEHFTPKSCRKFFSSQLKLIGNVNNAVVEYMMGHSLKRVEGAYIVDKLRDRPEDLLKIYSEHYGVLKIPF